MSSSSSSGDEGPSPPEEEMRRLFGDILDRFSELETRAMKKTRDFVVDEEEFARRQEAVEESEAPAVPAEGPVKVQAPQKKQKVTEVSRRQLKDQLRPDIAALKLEAPRPDLVEAWDVTAPDPRLLVYMKAYRNSVRVPIHWNQKRKHLSVKRTIEKIPFKLPDYIEATKISEIRAAILEKDAKKSLKQKQREKARPKAHRLYLDYKVLHDAFFKYASKPDLSLFGDVYYEGKEREDKARAFKPGQLSPKLREAIGMVLPNQQPPPWLFLMQRFGPPPSYPNLRIPGVNVGIPAGAHWGITGWGHPPTTGVLPPPTEPSSSTTTQRPVDEKFWGEISGDRDDSESEPESEEEEEEVAEDDDAVVETTQ